MRRDNQLQNKLEQTRLRKEQADREKIEKLERKRRVEEARLQKETEERQKVQRAEKKLLEMKLAKLLKLKEKNNAEQNVEEEEEEHQQQQQKTIVTLTVENLLRQQCEKSKFQAQRLQNLLRPKF